MVGHAIVSYLPNAFFLLVIALLTHFASKEWVEGNKGIPIRKRRLRQGAFPAQ